MISSAAPLLVMAILAGLGSRIVARFAWGEERRPLRLAFSLIAGCVAFHLAVTALALARIRWSPALLALAGLAALAAVSWRRPARSVRAAFPSDLGWGDGAALFAWLAFALLSASFWISTPDFLYHWGLKGQRYFLERGVDYAYLAQPWNWAIHPDYPNLLPELYAVTALVAKAFEPASQMLWTSAFFALLLLVCRATLGTLTGLRFFRQAGLALVALPLAAFGIGHQMAGAADWMPALALAAAAPALLRRPDRDGDLEVSLAAASKIEGVPLAFFLLAVQALRRILFERGARRIDLRSFALLGLPSLLVVLPWWWLAKGHHLFQEANSGVVDPARAPLIGSGLLEALALPAWYGLSWLVFLPLPLLLPRRTRAFATVAALQLAFFFFVYLTAPVDTRYYVVSSFPRLSLQLIPALLTVAVGWMGAERQPDLGRRIETGAGIARGERGVEEGRGAGPAGGESRLARGLR